ncbi:MAG: hypothetical protein QM757_22745 [Paludibaculum sp.]
MKIVRGANAWVWPGNDRWIALEKVYGRTPFSNWVQQKRLTRTGLGEPAVWQAQGSYWMLYTGARPEGIRRLGLARSQTECDGSA